jgi:hypothetical protein
MISFIGNGYEGRMRRCALAVAAVVVALFASAAPAADTGTIVVRLVTDPAAAGVSWSYGGVGSTFELGDRMHERPVTDLAPATYQLREITAGGGAETLTGLACGDPSHDSTTNVATATATVELAAGETVTCTFSHRALGPRPSAAATALAEQFAPTLRLSAAEHYRPIRAEDYLAHATFHTGLPPRGPVAQLHPTLFSLPTAVGASYLDIRGAQPSLYASRYRTIEQRLEQDRPRSTVYWRLAHQFSTGRLAIEYWFLYLYNDFVDRHEADWEHVTVFVDHGAPLGVAYSQHQGSAWSAWPATLVDDHPLVYVAAGSHANYDLPGCYRVTVCFTLALRHGTRSSEGDNGRGEGETLRASANDLAPLGGAGYTGSWGSGNYVFGFGLTKDRIVDPRRRSDYSNPFSVVPAGVG